MKHYLINTTWKCQLRCSYCWVRKHINKMPELTNVSERPLEDWVAAIKRDPPDVMDLGGGEPLSVPWTIELIKTFPNIQWGLSTNGLNTNRIEELASCRLKQITNINLSYHPETARKFPWYDELWKKEIIMLAKAGYSLGPNLMNTPFCVEAGQWAINWLKSLGLHMTISPICGGRKENYERRDDHLSCDAGYNHIVVGPDGTAWPCLSAIESDIYDETSLGNWLDDPLDMTRLPNPCRLFCVDYNVYYKLSEHGDVWGLHIKPMGENK